MKIEPITVNTDDGQVAVLTLSESIDLGGGYSAYGIYAGCRMHPAPEVGQIVANVQLGEWQPVRVAVAADSNAFAALLSAGKADWRRNLAGA